MGSIVCDTRAVEVDSTRARTGATLGNSAPQELNALVGTCIADGRFEVQELLGWGGQGAVFRVLRRNTAAAPANAEVTSVPESQRFVPRPIRTPNEAALKGFVPNSKHPSYTERFIAEYRIAARLKEGPFVRAYEMFELDGKLFYTMDLMQGGSLATTLGQRLPVAVAVGIVLDVLEGLDRLHGIGIVHRDIKHHNILLGGPLPSLSGGGPYTLPQARLSDFGISDVQDMVFGERSFYTMVGSLHFMAPELGVRDKVDARADLYAVGVLLFMLLSGRHPISHSTSHGQTVMALQRQLAGASVQRLFLQEVASDIPDEVAAVVLKLIEPNPDDRLRTAALAFDLLYDWFHSHASEHGVELSHKHHLGGRPYLAASAFCGRNQELVQAREFLVGQQVAGRPLEIKREEAQSCVPTPSVLVLSGEAGIGKTRLTSRIRKLAVEMGHMTHVISTQRTQGAYAAFRELQQELDIAYQDELRGLSPEEKSAQHSTEHPRWVPDREQDGAYVLLRQKQIRPEEKTAHDELHERYVMERFAALLRLRSYKQPWCMVIEDAQWLDNATLKYLFFAIRFLSNSKQQGHGCQVVWVLNHRPKDPEGDNLEALEQHLQSVGRMEPEPIRLKLSPFGIGEATELAASMLQLPASDSNLRRLVLALGRKRELTPLYMEQTLWALFVRGVLEERGADGRWHGQWKIEPEPLEQAGVPATVREAIGGRASHLNAETLRVLGVAALCDKEFDVEVVARAADVHAADVLTACEQAGRAGFLQQAQGSSQRYLADSEQLEMRFRFAHDRYREAILDGLQGGVRKEIHRMLERAVEARWGANDETYPVLAEHAYGAEEYGPAYEYAHRVADAAYAQGLHERAAQHYHIALESHAKTKELRQPVPLELRDRAAQSLHAVGRYKEATAQLNTLLASEGLPELLRMDYQSRLAISNFKQQDYKNALQPLLHCLQEVGVALPIHGVQGLFTQVQGLWSMLFVGPTEFFLNKEQAFDPERESLITQILCNAVECCFFVDTYLTLRLINYIAIRCTKNGIHSYTPALYALMHMITAMIGLHRISRIYNAQLSKMFPECEAFVFQYKIDRHPDLSEKEKDFYAAIAMMRISAIGFRGECSNKDRPQLFCRIRECLLSTHSCADPHRHWMVNFVGATIALFGGYWALYRAFIQDLLSYSSKYNLLIFDAITRNASAGWHSCLTRQWAQAQDAFTSLRDSAQDSGLIIFSAIGESMALLCQALDEPLPDADVVRKAIETVRKCLDRQQEWAAAFIHAAALAAAAVALHRRGTRRIPADFRKQMWRAYIPCMAQGQQKSIYQATQATAAAIRGQPHQCLKLFSHAATEAAEHGLLLQLLFVLSIAMHVLPQGSPAHAYYAAWLERLRHNLSNQPPVKLRDIEAGKLPSSPDSGQPLGLPPS